MRLVLLRLTVVLWGLAVSLPVAAQEAGGSASASVSHAAPSSSESSSAPPSAPPPYVPDPRTTAIRAFLAGKLDPIVDPESLFDGRLDDEAGIEVQVAHLRAVVRAARAAVAGENGDGGAASRRSPKPQSSAEREFTKLDPAASSRLVELEEARLEFYELSREARAELRRLHAERQAAAIPKETDEERRAREAEAERQKALEAARVARSESERLVAEELAKLIALGSQVEQLGLEFREARDALSVRRHAVLGWQRRGREARAAGPIEADSTYDALKRALDEALSEQSSALDASSDKVTRVPELWPDSLGELPSDIPTDPVRARRSALQSSLTELRTLERELARERAAVLDDEVNALNRERLDLLASLSPGKRAAIVGFTATGLEHARTEAKLVKLTLAHHRNLATAWITSAKSRAGRGATAWRAAVFLLPLFAFTGAFIWARRRSRHLFTWAEERLLEDDEAERRTSAGLGLRLVRFVTKLRRSLELLTLALGIDWLLPSDARSLLEVQLVSSIVAWSLAGAVVVDALNALAAEEASPAEPADSGLPTLRLRSLRFVGRTVVIFSLGLVLSARLVGEGTIHSWVSSLFLLATVPVFLVLVRWWRGPVFVRLDGLRKKSPLQRWVLTNRRGWKSFGAAMVGAVQLFALGTVKVLRRWLSSFELARRVHAYLFKREIERLGDERAPATLVPVPESVFEAFDPELPAPRWLACSADEVRDSITASASEGRQRVIAVVAARGMGKTSLLGAVASQVEGAQVIPCDPGLTHEALAARVSDDSSLVLLDDAQTLIEPRIGGLARFDDVLAFARSSASRKTWVFALDAALWPLLRRARDSRPMFDLTHLLMPWSEDRIGALIADRTTACGVEPKYDTLLDRLPPGSDEQDRQEALEVKRLGYQRMLWDHVGGNPGLALEAWRTSLASEESGEVHVRRLQPPDAAQLETLPDSSLFILRAVLQLAPARVEAVAQAVRLPPDQVLEELRAGTSRGFYEERERAFRITWKWLRAVKHLLERRHLLGGF